MTGRSKGLKPRLAVLWLGVMLVIVGVAASASGAVDYTKESLPEYAKQLAAGEIQSATFNRKLRSIRLTLKDGRHVRVRYEKHSFHREEARLKAGHVAVTVLTPSASNEEFNEKPKHHKIRYIVGGALIVVLLIVGAVLLIYRRRRRD
jgi:nitrate reductase gamma subunit